REQSLSVTSFRGPSSRAGGGLARLLPEGAVHLLVERWAARGELAQLVVLGPHQRRAVAEGAADALAIETAVLAELPGEVRHGQRRAADADEGDPTGADVGGPGVE